MALRVLAEGATTIGLVQYVLDHHHSVIHHHQPEIADMAAVKSARLICRVSVHMHISGKASLYLSCPWAFCKLVIGKMFCTAPL
jgi:hypothetical protein